jgi:predicted ATPase/DNA-binding winged helix-turn-helix (wHTH) protein
VSLDLRDVFKEGVALRIGTRAFDILELLIRHQGQLVSKEQILQRVWPDTVVEENNLQVHISALRKALGNDRDLIRTIPGRGYLLLGGEGVWPDAALHEASSKAQNTAQTPAQETAQGWPASSDGQRLPVGVDLVGRQALLADVETVLNDGHTLVTLIGPGGVGKTSLAVALGQQWLDSGAMPVSFVPLADLQQGDRLCEALSAALGVVRTAGTSLEAAICQHILRHPGLIILDNCEHLIDEVAGLVEALMRGAPCARLLATSREPLRIAGERSVQVPPLTAPVPDANREGVLQSASAQLFLRHWRALDCHVGRGADPELDDYSVELVGEVCRRLDGIPLALEMAAARASTLGLYQLVASLDDSVHLLTASLRTAPSRQQTLHASLAWSYRLLSRDERAVLKLLADLDGPFTLEQACHALQSATLARSCIMDCLVRLATQSLLMVSAHGPFRFYRMLTATRACLRVVQTREIADKSLRLDPRYRMPAATQAGVHALRAVPSSPDGYHPPSHTALALSR